jgi:membrane protein DedA with SNARE-associated domain
MNFSPTSVAVTLFFATFLSEDAAFLSSLVLAREGVLPPWLGIGASAAGIWVGDAGLFFLGRLAAEIPGARERIRGWESRARSSRFFASGERMIFIARFIPGARLPVFLGAGLLRTSVSRFLVITAVAVGVWMGVGSIVLEAWERSGISKTAGAAVIAAIFDFSFVLPRFLGKIQFSRGVRVAGFHFARLRYFEFWPMALFYPPVVAYYLLLSLRYRSIRLPLYSNPGIPNSGVVGESKLGILAGLSTTDPGYLSSFAIDRTTLTAESGIATALAYIREANLEFPLILKPDVGQRGSGVRLVADEDELRAYIAIASFRIVLQTYCPWSEEVGVNYVRNPGENSGKILGITRKRFPKVIGDGERSLADLILADPRARYIAGTYFARHADRLDEVLPVGVEYRLVESGNHCQGTIFEMGSELITPELTASVERIARQVPGFYVGRFDLRFESECELRAGRFKVIELNGAAGEATWIYDRRVSLFEAYGTLFGQLRTLFAIGAEVRRRGEVPNTYFIRDSLLYREHARTHPPTT